MRITRISRNTLSSVAKDAYLNYYSKTTHYAQEYLLNCFIVFLLCYSFKKPMRPSALFFSCRMPENLTRKAGFKVCGWLLHPVFDWERNMPSKESLPVRECNIGFV